MRKILATLFVPITLLISKFLERSEDEPRFVVADTLRRKEAWERKTGRFSSIANGKRSKPAKGFLTSLTLFVPITLLISKFLRSFYFKKPLAVLSIMIVLLASSPVYSADWVDEYFDAAVVTNPTAYQGQQQGYYTGGGFSARLSHKPDPLMNIQLPKIKAGCGGIDVFWGGISFMNFDYLVKKAEGLLKAAPYVLFSIGLKALSTQFGETIETVQAIVDQLNQLQFDECAAAKDIVNYVTTGETPAIAKEINDLTTNAMKLGQGISKHWSNATKATNDNPPAEKKKIVDANITDPLARELLTGSGTVLELLSDKNYITGNEAAAIRALVGDIVYDNPKQSVSFSKGCSDAITFEQYLNSPTPFQQTAGGDCKTNAKSIKQRADDNLAVLINALTDDSARKGNLNADVVNFINRSDIPVFAYLSSASITGEDYLRSAVSTVSSAVAAGYAYGSLNNLSTTVMSVISGLRQNLAKQDIYVETLLDKLSNYNNDIRKRMDGFQAGYDSTMTRLSTAYEMARKFEAINQNLYQIREASILIEGRRGEAR